MPISKQALVRFHFKKIGHPLVRLNSEKECFKIIYFIVVELYFLDVSAHQM